MPQKKAKPKSETSQYDYSLPEKIADVVGWTFEGAVRDAKKWFAKKSKQLDELVPPSQDETGIPKPRPKKIKERIAEEEEEGIKRGPGAWGRK